MEKKSESSTIAILGIGTAVPAYRIEQAELLERLNGALSEYPDSLRWAKRIFKQCGVETRYTCEPNLLELAADCRYMPSSAQEDVPATKERMEVYKRESVPLALEAAREALSDCNANPEDITHLITVSCTGQFLPGLDASLVQQLGLSPNVNRIPLQFLGCAAGLKAVCLSRQIVSAMPSAKILVVSVELCTLHLQPFSRRESLFAASFFGDGASACLVGCLGPEHEGVFQLGNDHTVLLPDCAEEMVWEVGNHGFELYLSPSIPKLIGQFIPAELDRLLDGERIPELWAIHPGGRGIVDAVQELFSLTGEQTGSSRSILRQYGNVSSATILFVLQHMRQELRSRGSSASNGVALAFGPGLTMEMIKFTYLPSNVHAAEIMKRNAYV